MDAGAESSAAVPERWRDRRWWQLAVAVAAVVGGGVAVWVTLPADFLRYSAWLAAQKADFVIGPALTGLYWIRRRPRSPFGLMLIAWGVVGVLYILQSSSDSWLFKIGLFWEKVFGLATYVLILAFPTGRLDRPSKIVLIWGVVVVLVSSTAIQLLLPQLGAGGSISSCRSLCPRNELAFTSEPALARDLFKGFSAAVLALALATTTLVVHRFLTGTPPRRRALAVGTPVALLFLACEMTFQLFNIVGGEQTGFYGVLIWVFVAARAAVWYGFLFALVAAELFAARAMQRLIEQSLHHPSEQELEQMLREPLGDPQLRLQFLNRAAGPDGARKAIHPRAGREVTLVERDGTPAVAIDHDAQLEDDPELLNAAGAVALLAAENARLDASSNDALQALRESRARIVRAGDAERRKVEQNLHDGVQQRLIAVGIEVSLVAESVAGDVATRGKLHRVSTGIEQALEDLREVAHGIYPPAFADLGLVSALGRMGVHSRASLTVQGSGVDRHSPEIESAVYYSCLEAIQNASKHGGPAVAITVALREQAGELTFRVSDDGPGFDPSRAQPGAGLHNMRDRLGALDGRLSITSAPGPGTTVTGRVPLEGAA